MTPPAPLIIVSGPSGSGKSTLIRAVVARASTPAATCRFRHDKAAPARRDRWRRLPLLDAGTLSATKSPRRLPRICPGSRSALLRHPAAEVDGYRERGIGVILDIDVQGAALVRPLFPDHLSIFVRLFSLEACAARLRQRATDSEETIARRMETAALELQRAGEYQHIIINEDLQAAVARASWS